MRILLLDFDGVLHSYTSKWQGADVVADPPVNGAAEFLDRATEHFDVHVLSSRSRADGGVEAMRKWCLEWFGHKVTNSITFAHSKPPAFLTIDDRCIRFEGEWPSMRELENFKPWRQAT